MATEIERRFLVPKTNPMSLEGWSHSYTIKQGYVMVDPEQGGCLRVRMTHNAHKGELRSYVTIKFKPSALEPSAKNTEFEWEISNQEAHSLFSYSLKVIVKQRHIVLENGTKWEVDVFEGPRTGLTIAECELTEEEYRSNTLTIPEWCGEEITGSYLWSNEQLAAPSTEFQWR